MTGALVLLVVLLVAAVAAVMAARRRRIDELAQHLAEANRSLEAVRTAELEASAGRSRAEADAVAAAEREQRARREAAEVARRLTEAQAAAGAGEARAADLEAQLTTLRRELDELEASLVRATEARLAAEAAAEAAGAAADGGRTGGPGAHVADVPLLWSLELGRTARTWTEAVAPGPGLDPPVGVGTPAADAAAELRAALEVEVDAARETTGALAELVWGVEGTVPPAAALVVLRAVQEVLAAVAKAADSARIEVADDAGDLVVAIQALDGAGGAAEVSVPALAALADGAGRYRVPALRGAPQDT